MVFYLTLTYPTNKRLLQNIFVFEKAKMSRCQDVFQDVLNVTFMFKWYSAFSVTLKRILISKSTEKTQHFYLCL